MNFCTIKPLRISVSRWPSVYEEQTLLSATTSLNDIIVAENENSKILKDGHLLIKNGLPMLIEKPSKQDDYSISISEELREIILRSHKPKAQQEPLWKLLIKNDAQELIDGDTIKMGTEEFNIYQIQYFGSICPPERTQQRRDEKIVYETKWRCRVCLGCETSLYDPMVNLCKCLGSVQFIHLKCLREWIKEGMETYEEYKFAFYQSKPLACQLCKENWPHSFTHNKKKYKLLNFCDLGEQLVEQNMISLVLETKCLNENGNMVSLFIKMNFTKDLVITFGSDEEVSNLLMYSPGISRRHCEFEMSGNKLFLRNRNDERGTWIKLRKKEVFSNKVGLRLIYHQMLLSFRRQNSFFECLDPQLQYHISLYEQFL